MGVQPRRSYRGKGWTKEACPAVIRFSFDPLCVKSIFAGNGPDVIAPTSKLKGNGFRYITMSFTLPPG